MNCSTGVFAVVDVVVAARLELGPVNDVGEREDDVRTQLGVDVLREELAGVRAVLRVAAVVAEQLRLRPTY